MNAFRRADEGLTMNPANPVQHDEHMRPYFEELAKRDEIVVRMNGCLRLEQFVVNDCGERFVFTDVSCRPIFVGVE